MRKIILSLAVSLDSYIEGPNGEYDWCIVDEEMDWNAYFDRFDCALYGRKSYELFGNQLPENLSEAEKPNFEKMLAMKKYVFSDTLTEVKDDSELVRSSQVLEKVNELKSQTGKDIWLFGGSSLITTFVNHNLVDVYELAVHPIVLGAGKPLFTDINQRVHLKLEKTVTAKSGVILLTYVPDRLAAKG